MTIYSQPSGSSGTGDYIGNVLFMVVAVDVRQSPFQFARGRGGIGVAASYSGLFRVRSFGGRAALFRGGLFVLRLPVLPIKRSGHFRPVLLRSGGIAPLIKSMLSGFHARNCKQDFKVFVTGYLSIV